MTNGKNNKTNAKMCVFFAGAGSFGHVIAGSEI